MLGHFLWINKVLVVAAHQEVRDQVKEDKNPSSCTEGHMNSTLFNAETFAHRSLDVEHIEGVFTVLERTVSPDDVFRLNVLQNKSFLVLDPGPRPDYGIRVVWLRRPQETDSLEERCLSVRWSPKDRADGDPVVLTVAILLFLLLDD